MARQSVHPFTAPSDSAAAAALRHVSDQTPGIGRKRSGRGFSYRAPDGTLIRDRATLERIRALAIPPAWTSVWISPMANGHIQATGRDAKQRKQYRYHARWHLVRDETKYSRMIEFGTALPRIRARVDADLALPGLPRAKVLAIIVSLLEATLIRVGNEEYARTNGAFGLTTLQNRHVVIDSGELHFRFRGKSGKGHVIRMTNRRLARLVQHCRELPGQDLFQFLDAEGTVQPINSSDVNDYIRDVARQEFTAKDFRTWAGTVLAARELAALDDADAEGSPKSGLSTAISAVAKQLGNTPAVCRKCYIHPAVIEAFEAGSLKRSLESKRSARGDAEGMSVDEAAVLAFLKDLSLPALAQAS